MESRRYLIAVRGRLILSEDRPPIQGLPSWPSVQMLAGSAKAAPGGVAAAGCGSTTVNSSGGDPGVNE